MPIAQGSMTGGGLSSDSDRKMHEGRVGGGGGLEELIVRGESDRDMAKREKRREKAAKVGVVVGVEGDRTFSPFPTATTTTTIKATPSSFRTPTPIRSSSSPLDSDSGWSVVEVPDDRDLGRAVTDGNAAVTTGGINDKDKDKESGANAMVLPSTFKTTSVVVGKKKSVDRFGGGGGGGGSPASNLSSLSLGYYGRHPFEVTNSSFSFSDDDGFRERNRSLSGSGSPSGSGYQYQYHGELPAPREGRGRSGSFGRVSSGGGGGGDRGSHFYGMGTGVNHTTANVVSTINDRDRQSQSNRVNPSSSTPRRRQQSDPIGRTYSPPPRIPLSALDLGVVGIGAEGSRESVLPFAEDFLLASPPSHPPPLPPKPTPAAAKNSEKEDLSQGDESRITSPYSGPSVMSPNWKTLDQPTRTPGHPTHVPSILPHKSFLTPQVPKSALPKPAPPMKQKKKGGLGITGPPFLTVDFEGFDDPLFSTHERLGMVASAGTTRSRRSSTVRSSRRSIRSFKRSASLAASLFESVGGGVGVGVGVGTDDIPPFTPQDFGIVGGKIPGVVGGKIPGVVEGGDEDGGVLGMMGGMGTGTEHGDEGTFTDLKASVFESVAGGLAGLGVRAGVSSISKGKGKGKRKSLSDVQLEAAERGGSGEGIKASVSNPSSMKVKRSISKARSLRTGLGDQHRRRSSRSLGEGVSSRGVLPTSQTRTSLRDHHHHDDLGRRPPEADEAQSPLGPHVARTAKEWQFHQGSNLFICDGRVVTSLPNPVVFWVPTFLVPKLASQVRRKAMVTRESGVKENAVQVSGGNETVGEGTDHTPADTHDSAYPSSDNLPIEADRLGVRFLLIPLPFPTPFILSFLLLFTLGLLFLIFESSYLKHHASVFLVLIFLYFWIMAIVSMLIASGSDPGIVRRDLDFDADRRWIVWEEEEGENVEKEGEKAGQNEGRKEQKREEVVLPRHIRLGVRRHAPRKPSSSSANFVKVLREKLSGGRPSELAEGRPQTNEPDWAWIKSKWCETCETFRAPRTSHCRICDNCVSGIDHHCAFLNNCIGRRNYAPFFAFLSAGVFCLLFVITTCIAHLVTSSKEHDGSFQRALAETPMSFVLLLAHFVVLLPVGALLLYHVRLLCVGRSTIEQLHESAARKVAKQVADRNDAIPSARSAVKAPPPNPYSHGGPFRNILFALGAARERTAIEWRAPCDEDEREESPWWVEWERLERKKLESEQGNMS